MAPPQHDASTFSVVIPTRDRAERVVHTIQSLQHLSGAADELVVVDDGSSDDTVARLTALEPAPVVLRSDGTGPATARNLGAGAATGEWLVFLDDDDDPHPDWMELLRSLAASNPWAQYVSVGFERVVAGTVTPVSVLETGPAFGATPANFIAGTFAVRRAAFERAGGFLDGLRCMEFTDLALQLLGTVLPPGTVVHDGNLRPITIHVRPPSARASQSAAVLEEAWHRVRERHPEAFSRDPRFAANQCSTVAVAWLREGETRRGRHWLVQALRTRPNAHDLARLGVSLVPPLRRRQWGSAA